jgi:hypothetical protein
MTFKKATMFLATCAILTLVLAPVAAQAQELTVVATQSTLKASQRWVDFLASQRVPIKHVEPAAFKSHKNAEYIVLMGGMDEAGIKELVTEAVGAEEAGALGKKGAGKMFLRSNVWGSGQNILVFAGSDAGAAEKARKDTKDDWWEMIAEWFDLEIGGPALHGY